MIIKIVRKKNLLGGLALLISTVSLQSQNINEILHSISGNVSFQGQLVQEDTAIGAQKSNEAFRYNAFGNVNYNYGKFSAGFRFESYNPVLLGFDSKYSNRSGIPYRFARYKHKDIDVTVGNFYEQFGTGLIFRSYEERGLLYDNAVEGMRVILTPGRGFTIKGIAGRQRVYWNTSDGTIKGIDGEVNINELFDSLLMKSKTRVILGGSFISKYQDDKNPSLVLPRNVGCYGGRLSVIRGGFTFLTEIAHKINDPSFQNRYSYREGFGAYVSASYAATGFSIFLAGKAIDNMSYRSERDLSGTAAMINYLPALSKPHTYMMMAYYPYASQPNGEIGGMGEVQYKIKKDTWLGGKYGMDITLNGSMFWGTDTTNLKPSEDSVRNYKYRTNISGVGDKYFHDFNIEINKKFTKKLKGTFMYSNQYLNQAIVQYGTPDKEEHPDVLSNIFVLDLTYRYKMGSAIRFETQLFLADYKKDHIDSLSFEKRVAGNTGSWVTAALEWTPNSKWFVVLMDQYNYENPLEFKKLHYYYAGITYVSGPTRVTVSYGRQRQGIFCAGGVCRQVPAFSGLSLEITTSF